jgi:hypothetical protein
MACSGTALLINKEGEEKDCCCDTAHATHKEAFGALLMLERLLAENTGDNCVVKALDEITDYVHKHFRRTMKQTTLCLCLGSNNKYTIIK